MFLESRKEGTSDGRVCCSTVDASWVYSGSLPSSSTLSSPSFWPVSPALLLAPAVPPGPALLPLTPGRPGKLHVSPSDTIRRCSAPTLIYSFVFLTNSRLAAGIPWYSADDGACRLRS